MVIQVYKGCIKGVYRVNTKIFFDVHRRMPAVQEGGEVVEPVEEDDAPLAEYEEHRVRV